MAVKLRLMRMGKKKQPTYRVVAADSRSPRDGRFIEIVGTYQPRAEPSVVNIDNDKAVVAAQGRPAHRAGREAAEDLRRLGPVQGRPTTSSDVTRRRDDGRPRRRRRDEVDDIDDDVDDDDDDGNRVVGAISPTTCSTISPGRSSTIPTPSRSRSSERRRRGDAAAARRARRHGPGHRPPGPRRRRHPHRGAGRRRRGGRRGRRRHRRLSAPVARGRAGSLKAARHHGLRSIVDLVDRTAPSASRPARCSAGRAADARGRAVLARTRAAGSWRFAGVADRDAGRGAARARALSGPSRSTTTRTCCGCTS